MDESIQRNSEAMHRYLVGELAYGQEDFQAALANFSRAGELLSEPEPILHAKLAELHVRAGNLEQALRESDIALRDDPDGKSLQLLQAGILEGLDRGADAEPIYRRVIELHPDAYEAYVLLASLYAKRSANEQAVQTLKKLVQRAPHEPIGHYYLGRFYEGAGQMTEAEASYERAVKLTPDNITLHIDLIRVAIKNRKFERAREICGALLERDPGNVTARRVLGQLLIGENKLDEALQHLQVLESVEEDASETRFKIAVIQIEKQNYPEAVRELTLVLAKTPEHAAARYYLASIYAGSGRRREAVDELLKIAPADEMFVKARMFAGFILRQEGDLGGAERVVQEALDKEPENKSVLSYLILVLREASRYEEAHALLQRAVARDSSDEKILFNHAVVLADLGRRDEAVEVMERVIAMNARYGDALNFIAYHLAERGVELERAEALSKRALETSPNDGYYLDTLGWIYFRQGRYLDAEELLSRAVSLTSGDVVIVEHYGDALIKNGKIDRGAEVYRAALETELDTNGRKETEVAERLRRKIKSLGDSAEGPARSGGGFMVPN
jgi:tetratricopeptide (TPR) repeat protein